MREWWYRKTRVLEEASYVPFMYDGAAIKGRRTFDKKGREVVQETETVVVEKVRPGRVSSVAMLLHKFTGTYTNSRTPEFEKASLNFITRPEQ